MIPRHTINGILTVLLLRSGGWENYQKLERATLMTCMRLSDVSCPSKELILQTAKLEANRQELDQYLLGVFLAAIEEIQWYYEYNTLH